MQNNKVFRNTIILLSVMLQGLTVLGGAKSKTPYAPTYGEWTSCRMWGGGYVQNVVLCPSNPKRVYAYADVAGPFRSDDGGNTWKALHGALPGYSTQQVRGLIVDPRDADRIIIATGAHWWNKAGIFISDDGGESFRNVMVLRFYGGDNRKSTGFILSRSKSNPDIVMAASAADGTWISRDNGKNWICVGMKDTWPTDLRFDRVNSKRIWLCSPKWKSTIYGRLKKCPKPYKSGFFRSDDSGKSWRKLADESPLEIIQDFSDPERLFGIFDERIIKLSLDGGEHWSNFSKGLPVIKQLPLKSSFRTSKHRFASLSAGPNFILTANTLGDFFRLNKGSSTWKKIIRKSIKINSKDSVNVTKPRFGHALGSITVDLRNPSHWFFTDWYSIWQTFDAGANWEATIDGIAQTVIHTVVADPFDSSIVYLGLADNPTNRSNDKGLSFKPVKAYWGDMRCIVPDPSKPSLVYACGRHTSNIFVSHDSGLNWRKAACKGLPKMKRKVVSVYTLEVHPNDSRLFACISGIPKKGMGGVYESSDQGTNWTWKGTGLPKNSRAVNFRNLKGFFAHHIWAVSGRELACSSDGSMVCISNLTGLIYYWDKASSSWKKSNLRLPMLKDLENGRAPYFDIQADPFIAKRFLLAAGSYGLLFSDDAGKNWKRWILTKKAGYVAFDKHVKGRVAVSTIEGIALSLDGGMTWKMLDNNIPGKCYGNSLTFQGDRLIVGTRSSGVFWIDIAKIKISP